ncbi:hypothetical protein AB0B28_05535 [Glycomyces sp. NPDC046736]|uniref:hypothetical protein n=1 Tax=Glycomyces sp. NPDC046736 TaxID=3155615 RepID=UPI0033DCD0B3
MLAVLFLVAFLSCMAAMFLGSSVSATDLSGDPVSYAPFRPALILSLLLVSAAPVFGFVLIFKRRNGGRAISFVVNFAVLILCLFAFAVGWFVDEEDMLVDWFIIYFVLGYLAYAVFLPFRRETREWFAPPLGYYEDEGDRLRAQIPFPLALALTGLWAGIGLIVLGAATFLVDPDLLLLSGANESDVPLMLNVVRGLLAWAIVQAVLCLILSRRNTIARIMTAGSALLAAPAGGVIGWLMWFWTGSTVLGSVSGVWIMFGGLCCWILVTTRRSVAWCAKLSVC